MNFMKKVIFVILILGFVIAAVAVGYFIFRFLTPIPEPEPIVNLEPTLEPKPEEPTNNEPLLEPLSIGKEGMISLEQCSKRGIRDKVIILETKYCSACKVAVPRLREIEKELNAEFMYFDLSKQEDLKKFKEFKIWPKYTPTVIIGCDVLIGSYSKDKYKILIEKFLNNLNK